MKEQVNFLAKFDQELWDKFQKKLSPYGESLKGTITDLVRIFVGDLERANKEVIKELKRILEEVEK
jgi:hypothetical protein